MSDTKLNGKTDFARMVNDVNALLRSKYKNRIIGAQSGSQPRFELYQAAASLCFHKVQTVLAEKQVRYVSHDMCMIRSTQWGQLIWGDPKIKLPPHEPIAAHQ